MRNPNLHKAVLSGIFLCLALSTSAQEQKGDTTKKVVKLDEVVVKGNLLSRGSAQYATVFQYKIKNWSLGAEWHYSAHDNYTEGSCESFNYRDNNCWKPLHYNFQLTATWSFSKGKARRHARKTLNNSSSDNGLTRDNTPQYGI